MPDKTRKTQQALAAFVQMFGLCGFALLPPLYKALTGSQVFFLAHQAGVADMLCFVLLLGILVPATVAAVVAVTVVCGRRVHLAARLLAVSLFVGLLLAPTLRAHIPLPGFALLLVLWAIGWGAAWVYAKYPRAQQLSAWLAPVTVAFSVVFLLQSHIVFAPGRAENAKNVKLQLKSSAPVVVLVFDEFSTESLLNADRQLDAELYPHFARLASDGYWMRDATTVSETTTLAIPALLTGRFPKHTSDLPNHQNYPASLFSLLHGAGYTVKAFEWATNLCPPAMNSRSVVKPPLSVRMGNIMSDVLVVAAHQFLPADLRTGLPSIDARTAHFTNAGHVTADDQDGDANGDANGVTDANGDADEDADGDLGTTRIDTPLGLFDSFLASIDAENRHAYFAHIELPHVPYQYLPSGKWYSKGAFMPGWRGDSAGWQKGDEFQIMAQQRYLMQVKFVDGLLGSLMDRLTQLGIYDKALVAIAADHGVSYRPGSSRRGILRETDESVPDSASVLDILKVPVLVKPPHRISGQVIDEKFQSTDFLPTLLGLLGASNPDAFDGRDILASGHKPLDQFSFFVKGTNSLKRHDLSLLSETYDISRKFRLFDPHNDFAIRFQAYDQLHGKTASELTVDAPAELAVELAAPEQYEAVNLDKDFVPAMVQGTLVNCPSDECHDLAIVINGIVQSLTKSYQAQDTHEYCAVVPESAFKEGRNHVEVFEVVGKPSDPLRLKPTTMTRSPFNEYRLDLAARRVTRGNGQAPCPIGMSRLDSFVSRAVPQGDAEYRFGGWVADLAEGKSVPETVVLFFNDVPIAWAPVNRHASDARFSRDTLTNHGFELTLNKNKLQGIQSLDDLELLAFCKDSSAQRLMLGGLASAVTTVIFPNLPEFRLAETTRAAWDFTTDPQSIREWICPVKPLPGNTSEGVSFLTTKSLQIGVKNQTLDANVMAAARLDVTLQRVTAQGEETPEPLVDVRLYWAREIDVTPQNKEWPFSEKLAVSGVVADPQQPDVYTIPIRRHAKWEGSVKRAFFSLKVPNDKLAEGEQFKVTLRSIELLDP